MKLSSEPDPAVKEHGSAIIGALWLAPEVAKGLGIYLATASHYEYMLLAFYRYAAGAGGEFVSATFGRINNISTRLDIVGDLLQARASSIPETEFKKATELLQEAREINSRRNELVHGVYRVYEKTRVVALITWPLSGGRKSKGEWITADTLKADTLKVAKFSGQMLGLCGVHGEPLEEHLRWP